MTQLEIFETTFVADNTQPLAFSSMAANGVPEGSKGEVWMLETLGNVHSLINACKQLGFKVNRITHPEQLLSAEVAPRLPFSKK